MDSVELIFGTIISLYQKVYKHLILKVLKNNLSRIELILMLTSFNMKYLVVYYTVRIRTIYYYSGKQCCVKISIKIIVHKKKR